LQNLKLDEPQYSAEIGDERLQRRKNSKSIKPDFAALALNNLDLAD